MPRFFRPKTGDQSSIVIEDDGNSYRVNPDGSRTDQFTVHSLTKNAMPVWTLTEMENLVAGGKWEEFQPGEPASNEHPIEAVRVGDTTHLIDESEPHK